MKKIAFFVEGQTEQLFVERLLYEVAGRNNILIESQKTTGGVNVPKKVVIISASGVVTTQKYYALIVDCSADSRVASEIRDNYDNFVRKGYESIVGLRDLYPEPIKNLPAVYRGMRLYMKTNPITVDIVVAVMEVEAWFLAEYSHFERIDPSLTCSAIASKLDFDPSSCAVEARSNPAADLNAIYSLARKAYTKRRDCVQAAVQALDFNALYIEGPNRSPSFKSLVDVLNKFFTA